MTNRSLYHDTALTPAARPATRPAYLLTLLLLLLCVSSRADRAARPLDGVRPTMVSGSLALKDHGTARLLKGRGHAGCGARAALSNAYLSGAGCVAPDSTIVGHSPPDAFALHADSAGEGNSRPDTRPAPTIDTVGYAGLLTRVLAAVQLAGQAVGPARARALRAAQALLSATVAVRLDGMTVQADLGSVRDDLAGGRFARAALRLAALRAALGAPSARLIAPDAHGLGALANILHAAPFVTPSNPLASVGAFLHDLVQRILRALFGATAGPVETLLPYLAGLIVAAALIYAARRLYAPFVPQAESDAETAGAIPSRIDAAEARARATALSAAGDYREAARYLFLSTLLALDESEQLRIDATTGNRDLLRQARAVPRLAEALTPVVRGFELFWFGRVPVTRQEYERYRQLTEQVLRVGR